MKGLLTRALLGLAQILEPRKSPLLIGYATPVASARCLGTLTESWDAFAAFLASEIYAADSTDEDCWCSRQLGSRGWGDKTIEVAIGKF